MFISFNKNESVSLIEVIEGSSSVIGTYVLGLFTQQYSDPIVTKHYNGAITLIEPQARRIFFAPAYSNIQFTCDVENYIEDNFQNRYYKVKND